MKNIRVTHKNVAAVVSDDEHRPAMRGVNYRPDMGELQATSGAIAARWPVGPSEGDAPAIIPPSAFNFTGLTRTGKKASGFVEILTNGKVEVRGTMATKVIEPINETFPELMKVWPEKVDREEYEIALDLALLKKLADAIPDGGNTHATFRFGKASESVLIEEVRPCRSGRETPAYQFLIMPVINNKYQ